MSDITVKCFHSSDAGAPVLSGTAGTLINVLNGCLNTGYGTVTLDSLVVSGNVATGTKSTGHGFTALLATDGITATGPVIRIAGSTVTGDMPDILNADWRITVTSPTQFIFATTGVTNQTATGTITAKRAPLDFAIPYTGTNKAVYRSSNIMGTQLYLRVDDSPNYSGNVDMYVSMSDVDTGTERMYSSSFGFGRSSAISSTARPWIIVGDGQLFFMHVDYAAGAVYFTLQAFGDIGSYVVGDAYKCILAGGVNGAGGIAPSQGGSNSGLFGMTGTGNINLRIARNYLSQIGTPQDITKYSSRLITNSGVSNSNLGSPDPVSEATLILSTIDITEGSTFLRGWLPGIYAVITNMPDQTRHNTVETNILQLPGKSFLILGGQSAAGGLAVDITGPWARS